MKATRLLIHGDVQGVGFRWFVRRAAEKHGVKGYCRNTADGAVEVIAQGGALAPFLEEIKRGPSFASVTGVDETEADEEEYTDFAIRH
jgi:acylphosphatase